MNPTRVVFRVHAIKRMFERRLTEKDVLEVLGGGETIEAHPNDSPFPSRLMLGWVGIRPLHVVVADNPEANEAIGITVYEPSPMEWESDYKQRKAR